MKTPIASKVKEMILGAGVSSIGKPKPPAAGGSANQIASPTPSAIPRTPPTTLKRMRIVRCGGAHSSGSEHPFSANGWLWRLTALRVSPGRPQTANLPGSPV